MYNLNIQFISYIVYVRRYNVYRHELLENEMNACFFQPKSNKSLDKSVSLR